MPDEHRQEDHFDEFERRRRPFSEMPDGSLRHETELIIDRASSSSEQYRGQALRSQYVVQRLSCGRQRSSSRYWPLSLTTSGRWDVRRRV